MASIVIWMQVRFLFTEIQKRIARHRNYLNVVRSMEARFSIATDEELEQYDDNCAICWDKMQVARKLPCGHFFHRYVALKTSKLCTLEEKHISGRKF